MPQAVQYYPGAGKDWRRKVTTRAASLAEHYWQRADVRGAQECWPWRGQIDHKGYALTKFRSKVRRASQVAWEIANGRPFPEGLLACHECDNPACVNPVHIWPGTQLDNIRDMIAKGRMANLQKERCPAGHPYSGDNLRMRKDGSRGCKACDRDNKRERYRNDPEYRLRIVTARRARRAAP